MSSVGLHDREENGPKEAYDMFGKQRLAEMIEEATVDAHDESEQAMGWFTMFEEYLELPFQTEVLGVPVHHEY